LLQWAGLKSGKFHNLKKRFGKTSEHNGQMWRDYWLEVSGHLHRIFLSSNAIENSSRNTKRKLARVTRFRAETDPATRWLAFALTEMEKGCSRISDCKDIKKLMAALQ